MQILLNNHSFSYEVRSILQIFYPNVKYQILNSIYEKNENDFLLVSTMVDNTFKTDIYYNNSLKSTFTVKVLDKRPIKYYLKISLFKALVMYTNKEPKWGILTGIKPTKIVYDMISQDDDERIISYLQDIYLLDKSKAELTLSVAKREKSVLVENSKVDGYHMYIGIPFCKSKCNYCSFTSFKIDKYTRLGLDEKYISNLIYEISTCSKFFKNRKLKSIYIGGGTPSSISANLIEKLLICINENFDLSSCVEISFEAGRADTITLEKLEVLKKYSITRIAINPQTMNNNTLSKINRNHSIDDFINVYNLAKKCGFDNINLDLIFGLTGETYEDFLYSVDEAVKLNPDSITIHTLSVKRGATIKDSLNNKEIYNIVDYHHKTLPIKDIEKKGFYPYYMYRQKNMIGDSNFENIGFSKEGKECLYNIVTMEEKEDIVAFGAGATSRKILDDSVERSFNVTGVEEYINRIDEMITRKKELYKK